MMDLGVDLYDPRTYLAGLPLEGGPRSIVLRSSEGVALALGELAAIVGRDTVELRAHVVFPWGSREGRSR